MHIREDILKEFLTIQAVVEDILGQIVRSEIEINDHSLSRLDKLAIAGAKLAYGGGCLEHESEQMHNLVAWCDHLEYPSWKATFIEALKHTPLSSPWNVHDKEKHS